MYVYFTHYHAAQGKGEWKVHMLFPRTLQVSRLLAAAAGFVDLSLQGDSPARGRAACDLDPPSPSCMYACMYKWIGRNQEGSSNNVINDRTIWIYIYNGLLQS